MTYDLRSDKLLLNLLSPETPVCLKLRRGVAGRLRIITFTWKQNNWNKTITYIQQATLYGHCQSIVRLIKLCIDTYYKPVHQFGASPVWNS